MKRVLCLVFGALICAAAALTGCGDAGSVLPGAGPDNDEPGGSTPGMGLVAITIKWPTSQSLGRALPTETARVDVVASGRTGVGSGFFHVRRSVTEDDVANGVVTITMEIPLGLGHVITAAAYDAANDLLVVGQTTIQFGGSPVAQARVLTYFDRDLGNVDPLPGEVIAYRVTSATGVRSIEAVDPEGAPLGTLSVPAGTDYFDPALSPGAVRLNYRRDDYNILQTVRGETTSANLSTLYPEVAGRQLAWSRTGDLIAFIADDDIWVAAPDGTSARRVRDTTEDERHPSFSPDGEEICFHLNEDDEEVGDIGIVDVDGGNWRLITTDLTAASTDWSPADGEIIFHQNIDQGQDAQGDDINDDQTLHIVDTAGAAVTDVVLDEDDEMANSFPRFSPDAELIVVVRRSHPLLDETDLWVFERDDVAELEQITETPALVEATPFWR